jgi:hypothetical protein
MPGGPDETGPRYQCRFVSADGERIVVAAEIVALDPRQALSRFVMMNGSAFESGKIEVYDEQGGLLLTRKWSAGRT